MSNRTKIPLELT